MAQSLAANTQRDTHYKQLIQEVEVLRGELEKKTVTLNEELISNKKLITKLQSDNAKLSDAYKEVLTAKANLEKDAENLKVLY